MGVVPITVCGTLTTRHEIMIIVIKFCNLKLFEWVNCYSSFDDNTVDPFMLSLFRICIIRIDHMSMICILYVYDALISLNYRIHKSSNDELLLVT